MTTRLAQPFVVSSVIWHHDFNVMPQQKRLFYYLVPHPSLCVASRGSGFMH